MISDATHCNSCARRAPAAHWNSCGVLELLRRIGTPAAYWNSCGALGLSCLLLGPAHSYASGRRHPPGGLYTELHALAERQDTAADQARAAWEEAGLPAEIEIGLASDDHEARSLGWPCVGAHAAVIRRVWELLPPGVRIIVVPRGSTPASAAAADAHRK